MTDPKASAMAGLGPRLKHLRRIHGLRMVDVAERVGCSESFISKIESGRTQPSLNMLHRVAQALDANMAQLFAAPEYLEDIVLREGRRPIISDEGRPGTGIRLERLIPYDPGFMLQGHIHHLAPAAASEGDISHQGEEAGYVISGEVELTVDGRAYVIGAGDSFHFRSERPHSYRNLRDETAKILWINTPPTY